MAYFLFLLKGSSRMSKIFEQGRIRIEIDASGWTIYVRGEDEKLYEVSNGYKMDVRFFMTLKRIAHQIDRCAGIVIENDE